MRISYDIVFYTHLHGLGHRRACLALYCFSSGTGLRFWAQGVKRRRNGEQGGEEKERKFLMFEA